MKYFLGLIFLLSLTGCQTQPTKGYDNQTRPTAQKGELTITENTVFVDARSPFLYNLSHLPKAINFSWEEFTESRKAWKGRLVKDLFNRTRRLARLGIGPDSSVVVIGEGKAGRGEEGRLAWTLNYLGVKDVHFASKDFFDQTKWVHGGKPEAPLPSVPMWKPNLNSNIIVDPSELRRLKEMNAGSNGRTLVFDVRGPSEFLKGHTLEVGPNIKVLNIEWKEFVDEQGRPNHEVVKKIKQLGIKEEFRIIVVSESGVESGAVVHALNDMGFPKAAHFPGGFREIWSQK